MHTLPTLSATWRYLHEDVFNKNDIIFFITGQTLVTYVLLFVVGGFFTCADFTGRPHWLLKYKVQSEQNVPVDKRRLVRVIKVVLWNFVFLNIPFALPLYAAERYAGCSFETDDLPSPRRFARDILGCVLVGEITFYYLHRLLHWGPLYRSVHKRHHEWTAPFAITAAYAHPLEHLTANIVPFTLGPVLMSSHFATQLVWFSIALFNTLNNHSGYHLPLAPSPQRHDYHHLKFNVNYGSLGLMDWLHGTDTMFRQSVQFTRHRRLLQLKPISISFPDRK